MKRKINRTYTIMDMLMASPTKPMPVAKQIYQLDKMREGLTAMERAPEPTKDNWRCVADVVNLFETMVIMGIVEDLDGLLRDGTNELAKAAIRSNNGDNIRLSGKGIQACRAMVDDYAQVLCALPERTMIDVHIKTEKRLQDIHNGKRNQSDLVVSV